MAAEHSVRVVEDGTLATDEGWMLVRSEVSGELYFVVERSAAVKSEALNDAWHAAAQLVIEQAVREGIVQYTEPPAERPPAS